MKKIHNMLLIIIMALFALVMMTNTTWATSFGSTTLPSWAGEATYDVSITDYTGGNTYETVVSNPSADGAYIWFCFVFDRDVADEGEPRFFINIDWDPTSDEYEDFTQSDEWLNGSGVVTTDPNQAEYGRVTASVHALSVVNSETIGFGALTPNGPITELYVLVKAGGALVPPVADAGLAEYTAQGGEVTLDGSGSYDSDGTIMFWDWDLAHQEDPANDKTVSGETPTVTGLARGTYDVTLTVTDDDGLTDTDETIVTNCFISSLAW